MLISYCKYHFTISNHNLLLQLRPSVSRT